MDKMRFIEQQTKNYWHDFYVRQMQPGGAYCGKTTPLFSYVVLKDIVLLYSNHFQIAYFETFDWNKKVISSWEINADKEFWNIELSGFKKIEAVQQLTMGVQMHKLDFRGWE